MCSISSLFADGPTMHWADPKTLVNLKIEGHETNSLADSGSQVNTVICGYVFQHEFPVLLLGNLDWSGWHEDATSQLHDLVSTSH